MTEIMIFVVTPCATTTINAQASLSIDGFAASRKVEYSTLLSVDRSTEAFLVVINRVVGDIAESGLFSNVSIWKYTQLCLEAFLEMSNCYNFALRRYDLCKIQAVMDDWPMV